MSIRSDPSGLLSGTQFETLDALCRTLAGADAEDSAAPLFTALLAGAAGREEHRQFRLALNFLESRTLNALLTCQFRRLTDLSPDGRERVLRAWANSRLGPLRRGFQTFKRLALFLTYARPGASTSANPRWAEIKYPGPAASGGELPKKLAPLQIREDTTLEADAVVIGSGAGGGVVAAELAAAGHRVVILEKGEYLSEADFQGAELSSSQRMFEKRGILATQDGGVTVLAGSTLGGGTTINWMTSLRTPDHVLLQWEREFGVHGAAGPEWQASLDAVCTRLNVGTSESIPNAQNQRLIDGSAALGYRWRTLPRNVRGCRDCGFCNFGCKTGAKQSTLKTYLQDAQEHGAEIVAGCRVERVLVENGVAAGVTAAVNGHRLTVRSRIVVAAGGSIQTPALLRRSGLRNRNIGRHLFLHPVAAVFGIYPQPVEGWRGAIQTAACDHFADRGDGYGFVIEVPPVHPGLAALGLPWQSAAGHRDLMRQAAHMAVFIAITRDRDGGSVRVDRRGQPVLHYTVSARDTENVIRSAQEAVRLHAAAGAHTIGGPYNSLTPLVPSKKQDVEAYVREFPRRGVVKNDLVLFSAHQMSSCRMGKNSNDAPVTPEGEAYEVRNLFVADGSALPTSTGVNPMISIMALAHHNARIIKSRM